MSDPLLYLHAAQSLINLYRNDPNTRIATFSRTAYEALNQAMNHLSAGREQQAADEIAAARGWVNKMETEGLAAIRVANIRNELDRATHPLPMTTKTKLWIGSGALAGAGLLLLLVVTRK